MFCRNCGFAISDEKKACPNCGTLVNAQGSQPDPGQPFQPNQPDPGQPFQPNQMNPGQPFQPNQMNQGQPFQPNQMNPGQPFQPDQMNPDTSDLEAQVLKKYKTILYLGIGTLVVAGLLLLIGFFGGILCGIYGVITYFQVKKAVQQHDENALVKYDKDYKRNLILSIVMLVLLLLCVIL